MVTVAAVLQDKKEAEECLDWLLGRPPITDGEPDEIAEAERRRGYLIQDVKDRIAELAEEVEYAQQQELRERPGERAGVEGGQSPAPPRKRRPRAEDRGDAGGEGSALEGDGEGAVEERDSPTDGSVDQDSQPVG